MGAAPKNMNQLCGLTACLTGRVLFVLCALNFNGKAKESLILAHVVCKIENWLKSKLSIKRNGAKETPPIHI